MLAGRGVRETGQKNKKKRGVPGDRNEVLREPKLRVVDPLFVLGRPLADVPALAGPAGAPRPAVLGPRRGPHRVRRQAPETRVHVREERERAKEGARVEREDARARHQPQVEEVAEPG